ncbi:unnamed protein product [Darwinula stevensoni]|uniref:Protein quiver n=1 Tax=Darwinula stevensoni TaxID=69355 RepID=A0A7R8XDP0_9CRUS|nr:unnamed protein product [Darwinula stevensoni]CAG0893683.1 unnamed protein product [Darwinula stevensoni]
MSNMEQVFCSFSFLLVFFSLLSSCTGIRCYECNSKRDPGCADPFTATYIEAVDCDQKLMPHLGNVSSSLCRKIVQRVGDDFRYVRSCGWLGKATLEDGRHCYTRAGTFKVQIMYCSCDGEECNHASTSTDTYATLLKAFAFLFLSQIAALPL